MMRERARRALLGMVAPVVAVVSCAHAQEVSQSYTTSSSIEAQPLAETSAKAIASFLSLPLKSQHRKQLAAEVCQSGVSRPDAASEQIKVALGLTEAEITAELTFENASNNNATANYLFEFSQDAVLIRSSNPRYESQAEGLRVGYPHESTKTIWFEGKLDTSILFLIPPVRDCSTQFILACPRSYSKSRTLDETSVTIRQARYFSSAKADGLFKAPEGTDGKIQASLLSSSRVTLPTTWSSENTSRETPSASIKQQRPLNTHASALSFSPISAPFADSIEARLEYGEPSKVLRRLHTRATFSASPFRLESPQGVKVELSELTLQPGSCFVISRRKESQY